MKILNFIVSLTGQLLAVTMAVCRLGIFRVEIACTIKALVIQWKRFLINNNVIKPEFIWLSFGFYLPVYQHPG